MRELDVVEVEVVSGALAPFAFWLAADVII
jgi:hypothetical protein